MKILIFGHSGSGKSTLAKPLSELINGVWLNADAVRNKYRDWDFSETGRLNQANRMRYLADGVEAAGSVAVIDFIAPTLITRKIVNPDFVIWMDTIKESKFEDTNALFEPPNRNNEQVDYHVKKWFDDTHLQLLDVVKSYMVNNNSS